MQKLTFTLLLSLFSLVIFGQNKSLDRYKLPWIPFSWEGDTISGKYYDKAGMNLPVRIAGLPYQFSAQFDLGSFASVLYGKSLKNYEKLFPALARTNDTLHYKNRTFPVLKGMNIKLGERAFNNLTMVKLSGFGDEIPADSINTATVKHIGTIGVDICKDKILIIDYPNQRICLLNSLPPALLKYAKTVNARFTTDNRVNIPFQIGKETEYLMFDTGSSIFPIFTLPKNAAKITSPTAPILDSLKISAWGNAFYVYKKQLNQPLYLGKTLLKDNFVFYSDKAVSSPKFFEDNHIFGFTGNLLFLDKVLIIDFKHHKMSVL